MKPSPLFSIALLLLISNMDLRAGNTIMILRVAYCAMVVLQTLANWYALQAVQRAKDTRKIWIKNPQPMLQPGAFVETTYLEHESTVARQGMQQAVMGAAVMALLHFKMGLDAPLVLQLVTGVMGIFGSPLFKKHVLREEVERPWGESLERPAEGSNGSAPLTGKAATLEAYGSALVAAWDAMDEAPDMEPLLDLLRREQVEVDEQLSEPRGRWTILMVVAGHGKVSTAVLDELLRLGPDLTLQDSDGWTALHWACFHDRGDAVTKILEAAMNMDEALEGSSTLLSAAYEESDQVRQLVEMTDLKGFTAAQLAASEGSTSAIEALTAAGVPVGAAPAEKEGEQEDGVPVVAAAGAEEGVDAAEASAAGKPVEREHVSTPSSIHDID